MKKYRVFSKHIGWGECMYIFNIETTFKEIKEHIGTRILTKSNYIGEFEFNDKFINYFQKMTINNQYYFIRVSYDNDIEEEKEETLF